MEGTINNYNGIYYRHWKANNDNYVFVVQGSGEYSTKLDGSDLPLFIDKNSYAILAAKGQSLPFNVVVVATYKPEGTTGNAPHGPLMANISAIARHLGAKKAILSGYSLGGQFTAGMLTQSRNSGQTTSYYKDPDIWIAYLILCGKAPGTPDFCINATKPVLLVHGDSDDAVGIGNSIKIRDYSNKCLDRNLPVNLITIPGGEHNSAWVKGYNPQDPVGAQVYAWVLDQLKETEPPVEIEEIPLTSIVLKGEEVIATFGDKKVKIIGEFI